MATLVAILLIIINEDVMRQYNCQVGILSHDSILLCQILTSLYPKVTTTFMLVSMPHALLPPSPKGKRLVRSCSLYSFFSDLSVPSLLYSLTLGRTSNVSIFSRYC